MFRTCLFCEKSLGSNEVIEHLPFGRRLAFDPSKGRLWVVCQRCERWNLVPLEARWEAVEACEKTFRDARLRVSTENVGLCRLPEGLELVRIGSPLRTEFAAWRYGDQFGRRRRRAILVGAGGLAALAAATFVGPALVGGSGLGGYWIWQAADGIAASRTRAALHTRDGRIIKLKRDDLPATRIRPGPSGDGFRLSVLKGKKQEWFEGAEAEHFAGLIVPKMNRSGGSRGTVASAVQEIERHGHPDLFIQDLLKGDRFKGRKGAPGFVGKMPAALRLALEMSLHEEDERRALEGELWRLERAWEAEEEIAAISDDLLLPRRAAEFLARDSTSQGDTVVEESP